MEFIKLLSVREGIDESLINRAFVLSDEFLGLSKTVDDAVEKRVQEILNTPPDVLLNLSVRTSNCLKNANINTVRELTRTTEEMLTHTRNFGKKSLLEIRAKLGEYRLETGSTDYSKLRDYIKPSP